MNVVLALLHEIEEYDQTRLLTELGYDVFSIGAYSDPVNHTGLRPPLPNAPDHPDLREACENVRRLMTAKHGPPGDHHDWAKYHLPDEVIDWMDVFIVHHAEHTFIPDQWERIKHKRVIWRTVGQSVQYNENVMTPYRAEGMQIVRYSPKERNIVDYAGEDALIRFYKDPAEWGSWTGEEASVANVTQFLREREPFTNYGFWRAVTEGLPAIPAGPGSDGIGGLGELSYDEMKAYLRRMRVYLYTGTQPASYTLGLIEAMMTGIPVVSIAPQFMRIFPYSPDLFEGAELAGTEVAVGCSELEIVGNTQELLRALLVHPDHAASAWTRQRAIELFGMETIGRQWVDFLGLPKARSYAREAMVV